MKKLFYYLVLSGVFFVHSNIVAQTAKNQNLGTVESVISQFSTRKINQEFLFKLSSDQSISVKITAIENVSGQQKFFGALKGVKSSVFYLNLNSKNVTGKILDNDNGNAYLVSTNAANEVVVREAVKNEVICEIKTKRQPNSSRAQKKSNKAAAIPILNSNPGAPIVIYLDFDGEYIDDSYWNNQIGGARQADAPNFNEAFIKEVWATIAEDYRPFNITVTTDKSVFDAGVRGKRIQCIVTPSFTIDKSGGYSEFDIISNDPLTEKCFVFNDWLEQTVTDIAQTGSHESGHGFNCRHDGSSNPQTNYWKGHGNYGAIMGSNYQANRGIYHWSKGEYQYATTQGGEPNTQDDIESIATRTGSSFRTDDHGGTTDSATALKAENNGNILASENNGIIEQRTDKDYFSFTHGGGNIVLNLQSGTNTTPREANLDIQARLLNSEGEEVAFSDPEGLNAAINTDQPAGTYYLEIDGVGSGDPFTNGYSDYGSLGYYEISGSYVISTNSTVCDAPSSLNVENVGSTTATLNWAEADSVSGYTVQVKPTSSSTWQSYSASSNVYNLTQLNSGTTYEWQVKSTCSSSSSSNYTSGSNFTPTGTTTSCSAPESASASNITSTSATLNWSSTEAPNYYIYVLPEGEDWYSPASDITDTSYNLSGLAANKSYTVDIYSNCAGDALAKRFTFTTNSSSNNCEAPASASASNISSTTATLEWSSTSAPNYDIYMTPNGGNRYLQTYDFTGTYYNLTGLSPDETYTVDVYSNCPDGAVATTFTFTTSSANGAGNGKQLSIVEEYEDVTVFPNPSTNNFTLQLENSTSQFADVIISTISGTVVYTASNLDVSLPFTFGDQLPAGVYIIKMFTAEKTSIKKVIKQ